MIVVMDNKQLGTIFSSIDTYRNTKIYHAGFIFPYHIEKIYRKNNITFPLCAILVVFQNVMLIDSLGRS